jgi:hypothetical protein
MAGSEGAAFWAHVCGIATASISTIGWSRIIAASKSATVRCAGSSAHDRLATSVVPTTSYATFSVPTPEPISKSPPPRSPRDNPSSQNLAKGLGLRSSADALSHSRIRRPVRRVCDRVALCANDDETPVPFEFRLGHRRMTSWLCPTPMTQST